MGQEAKATGNWRVNNDFCFFAFRSFPLSDFCVPVDVTACASVAIKRLLHASIML
jgi:hypothetical protein